jgi:hypothetical protein
MAEIIKDTNSHVIAAGVKPDAKKRVRLSKVPVSEACLFKNPEALESVKAGLKEAAEKKVLKVNVDEL